MSFLKRVVKFKSSAFKTECLHFFVQTIDALSLTVDSFAGINLNDFLHCLITSITSHRHVQEIRICFRCPTLLIVSQKNVCGCGLSLNDGEHVNKFIKTVCCLCGLKFSVWRFSQWSAICVITKRQRYLLAQRNTV